MNTEKIRELVEILEGYSLNFMEVSEGDFHLKLGKTAPVEAAAAEAVGGVLAGAALAGSTARLAIPAESEAIVADHGAAHGAGEAAAAEAPVGTPVKSPMVGVFYEAPSPEAEPFVQEGQEVKKGQVLCIIEAMKLMNEIAAEQDGVVTRVCVKNGDIVEFGQPLLYIR